MCVPRMPCYVCAMDARVRYSVSGGVGREKREGEKSRIEKRRSFLAEHWLWLPRLLPSSATQGQGIRKDNTKKDSIRQLAMCLLRCVG